MDTKLCPFPTCAWQGLPALRVMLNPAQPLDQQQLHELRASTTDGTQLIWLQSPAWSHDSVIQFVRRLLNDDRMREYPISAVRGIHETEWPMIEELEWIVDISATFGRPFERDEFHRMLTGIEYVPQSREVIWCDPPLSNVSPHTLELIAETLRPEIQSWIYTTREDDHDAIFHSAARSTQPWGVRRMSEQMAKSFLVAFEDDKKNEAAE